MRFHYKQFVPSNIYASQETLIKKINVSIWFQLGVKKRRMIEHMPLVSLVLWYKMEHGYMMFSSSLNVANRYTELCTVNFLCLIVLYLTLHVSVHIVQTSITSIVCMVNQPTK